MVSEITFVVFKKNGPVNTETVIFKMDGIPNESEIISKLREDVKAKSPDVIDIEVLSIYPVYPQSN